MLREDSDDFVVVTVVIPDQYFGDKPAPLQVAVHILGSKCLRH
jgi:hypothetical protein